MKPPSLLSVVAIIASAIAIGVSVSAPKPLSPAEFDAAVDAALAKRERSFVERHAPAFKAMFAEMDGLDGSKDWSPETLEDLIAPLVKIVTEMGGQ